MIKRQTGGPPDYISEVFKKYPGLSKLIDPRDYTVEDASGKMKDVLNKNKYKLEYVPKGEDRYIAGQDTIGVANPGKNRIYINPDMVNSKDRQSSVSMDLISHGLQSSPDYKNFEKDLESRLVSKYGKQTVQGNDGVAGYIRGYLSDNPEYKSYKEEMKFLPKDYFNPLDHLLGVKTKFPDGGQTKKPIVVTDPNDPRLKAYTDSLALYNEWNQDRVNNLLKQGFIYDTEKGKRNIPLSEKEKRTYQKNMGVNPKKGLQSITQAGNDGKQDNFVAGEFDTRSQKDLFHGTIAPVAIAPLWDKDQRNFKRRNKLDSKDNFIYDDHHNMVFEDNPKYGEPFAKDKAGKVIRPFFTMPIYQKPNQPVSYLENDPDGFASPLTDTIIDGKMTRVISPVQAVPKNNNPSPVKWDGMVEKADGSIRHWGNDWKPAPENNYGLYPQGTMKESDVQYLKSLNDNKVNSALARFINKDGARPSYGEGDSDMFKQLLDARKAPSAMMAKKELGGKIPPPQFDYGTIPDISFDNMPGQQQSNPAQDLAITEGNIEPQAVLNKKLSIKDYLSAATNRLQQNSNKFLGAFTDPMSAVNLLGYGADVAGIANKNRQNQSYNQYYNNLFNSDNMFPVVDPLSDRGDYSNTGSSYGAFRPDQMGFKGMKDGGSHWIQGAVSGMRKDHPCTGSKFGSSSCPPGSKRYVLAQTFRKMNHKEFGGEFQEEQEYELTPDEIMQILANGGSVEYL